MKTTKTKTKTMEITKTTKIKDYLIQTLQPDEIDWFIDGMDPVTSFEEVYDLPEEVYQLTGMSESEIRVLIFKEIAKLYDIHYDKIYYRWLGHDVSYID